VVGSEEEPGFASTRGAKSAPWAAVQPTADLHKAFGLTAAPIRSDIAQSGARGESIAPGAELAMGAAKGSA